MRHLKVLFILIIGLAVLLTACSGVSGSSPTQTPDPVKLTLQTVPDPPVAGKIQLNFAVLDNKGQPIPGADFDVIADHTDMGGMTMHGKASDQGNGRYAITTNFAMSGKWKITVEVKTATLDYKKDIDLQIR
jgi:uncharacterized GH25 family protein